MQQFHDSPVFGHNSCTPICPTDLFAIVRATIMATVHVYAVAIARPLSSRRDGMRLVHTDTRFSWIITIVFVAISRIDVPTAHRVT